MTNIVTSSDAPSPSSGSPDGALPSGLVTFLFTDIEGSTVLWEARGDEMAAAVEAHDRLMREAAADHDGYVFTTAGDSFSIAFAAPLDAVAAAVQAQQALAEPLGSIALRVRMGVHAGAAIVRSGDYFGPVLNRAARLMAAGHGGQVLVSGAVHDLVAAHLPAGWTLLDLGEHQLKDLARPEHIFQLQHPALAGRFPPLLSIRTTATNLPVQLTSFVGRHEELSAVADLLAANRLVTLSGPGGSGKTRLAIQLGAELLDHYPGGVRLVELAPLSDADHVADEVAKVLGVTLQPERTPAASIADKIGDRRMLVIIDNSEHLIDTVAALVVDLLQRCPGLTLLVTSIEVLRVPGEVPYRLAPMTLPAHGDPVEAVRATDAVRLFTERAVTVQPDFAVTDDNVGDVIAIARHLDGIPLALELAAARLRTLAVSQIAARLDERFRLLSGGERTAAARHQTLLAAIEWSHDLLTEAEQVLFRRLSVFTGNFTLDAMEQVCAAPPLDPVDILDLVAEVVDKSMVATEDGPQREMRYRLLGTLRSYGRMRLSDAGEEAQLQLAHLRYFMQLAADLDEQYLENGAGAAVALLGEDHDNFRAALDFALAEDHLPEAAEIFSRLWFLWYHTGRSREAFDRGRDLFAKELDLPQELMAGALHGHGTLLGIWGEAEAGIDLLQREVALRRGMDGAAELGSALNNLGNLLRDCGRTVEAEAAFREGIEVRHAAGLPAPMQLINLAEVALNAERYDDAEAQYNAALQEAESVGDAYGVALAQLHLGSAAVRRGRPEEARRRLEEARQSFVEQGVRPGVAEADFFLGLAARAQGRRREAVHCLLSALDASDAHWEASLTWWTLQATATVISDHEVAASLLGTVGRELAGRRALRPAYFERDHAAAVAQVTEALGEEQFAARAAEGERAPFDGAIATARYALREEL